MTTIYSKISKRQLQNVQFLDYISNLVLNKNEYERFT
jgi:hypothetical protein